jgi:ABC-type nickel/cobalt efflux system permease component RcnA
MQIICCAARVWGYVVSMEWQQLVSLMIVASAAGLLVWSKVRRQKFSLERQAHCGCAAVSQSSPQSSIVFRARKGQRPEVRVRMR